MGCLKKFCITDRYILHAYSRLGIEIGFWAWNRWNVTLFSVFTKFCANQFHLISYCIEFVAQIFLKGKHKTTLKFQGCTLDKL